MRSFLTVSASLGDGAMVRTLLEIKGEKMLFVLTHHLNLCHQKCGGGYILTSSQAILSTIIPVGTSLSSNSV